MVALQQESLRRGIRLQPRKRTVTGQGHGRVASAMTALLMLFGFEALGEACCIGCGDRCEAQGMGHGVNA